MNENVSDIQKGLAERLANWKASRVKRERKPCGNCSRAKKPCSGCGKK